MIGDLIPGFPANYTGIQFSMSVQKNGLNPELADPRLLTAQNIPELHVLSSSEFEEECPYPTLDESGSCG